MRSPSPVPLRHSSTQRFALLCLLYLLPIASSCLISLPISHSLKVASLIGTAEQLRAIHSAVDRFLSLAPSAASLDVAAGAAGVVSAIVNLLPLPSVVKAAFALAANVLRLGQLLCAGAPYLMIVAAVLAVLSSAMGIGGSKVR